MAKLDRLGWASGLSFSSFGARVGVRVNDPEALARVSEHLPPHARPARSPVVDELYSLILGGSGAGSIRRFHVVYVGNARIARTTELDEALAALESDLHFTVALRAPRHLFVHAGVVGWRGKAILIPGRSYSGKSRLVQALVAAGAEYYSDEFAVLDARGRVHPFARPLQLRDETGKQRRCTVEELGGRAGGRPLAVGLVVATAYEPGACWRPRRLTSGEALLALLDNTVVARLRPEQALEMLRPVAMEALCLRGKRGEADEVAAAILERLAAGR